MNAVKFPDMIGSNNQTKIIYDKDATGQNVRTLLLSVKKTLLGDPYFGVNLQKLLFERNNLILRDLVVDEIVTALNTFIPQLYVRRSDVEVQSDGTIVDVTITGKNMLNYDMETYTINLLNVEEL